MTSLRDRLRVHPDKPPALRKIDPSSTPGVSGKAAAQREVEALGGEIAVLQDRLLAQRNRAVLVVLQAMDTGGKDGTVSHVFRGLNPEGVEVSYFKEPTPDELAHDFLWRVHARVPAKGVVGVFNRSHYEDVLVARVHRLVPKRTWRERYRAIRNFEALLTECGTTVLKLMLHISKDEQRKRLQDRLDDPTKRWKFNPGDLKERERWDDYMAAYEDALGATSTSGAPWYVVPADHEWYRNWAVSTLLLEALRDIDPQYPEPPDLRGIEVR